MFIPPDDYSMIRSLQTGARLWVPTGAVPMLTDRPRCPVHGTALTPPDVSMVDVIASDVMHAYMRVFGEDD